MILFAMISKLCDHKSPMSQTERQTDRQTDGRHDASDAVFHQTAMTISQKWC